MQQKFFEPYGTKRHECSIQIPSPADLVQMQHMPAGGKEDQHQRLKHMAEAITNFQKKNSLLPVITTDEAILPASWLHLFVVMQSGDSNAALQALSLIPEQDSMLQAILAIHTLEYIQKIIKDSIRAQSSGISRLNSDIILTPGTFEVLIKDLALTLSHSAPCHFSFGLPTHHAFSEEGSGFCILNKTAILMKHTARTQQAPLKYIVIGIDVNRDNGLCAVLNTKAAELDVCHIDIFDSRVYPWQGHAHIAEEYQREGESFAAIQYWQQKNLAYFAVDLSQSSREGEQVHSALIFAITKMKEQVRQARRDKQKIVLLLPTGWDSHENETAACGKYLDNQYMMADAEAKTTRFSDNDLTYFFERVLEVYQENKEHIVGMYWGLEGGYDRPMYEQQIQLMMSSILKQLLAQKLEKDLSASVRKY